jgi:GntR family transcriptional regulator/MocR family aminotransferase
MTRRSEFTVPPIQLDRASTLSLHRQVHAQIATAIRSGAIRKGAKLPSTRMLARLLKISRNTVLAAYEELISDGLLQPHNRSGMQVTGSAPALTLFGLRATVRAAHSPARIQPFEDPDGNHLYIVLK